MPDPVELSAVFGLPPEKAIEYFQSKGYAITWNWDDLWQEAHAKAFTVAKVMNTDILNDIRGALDEALNNGTTLRDFQKNLTPTLQAKGWWGKQLASKVDPSRPDMVDPSTGEIQTVQLGSPRRLRTIYQTNLQTAYMAGRYRSMVESAESHPYWMYVSVLDGRTRPAHRAMNGRVFRYDDPVWKTHYPPNGFNCRCRVRALMDFEVTDMGITVSNSNGALIDHNIPMRDGSSATVKALRINVDGKEKLFAPDAGWSYNPGEAAFGNDIELMRKISAVKDREIRVQAVQAINNSGLRHQVFANWVSASLVKRSAGHEAQVAGFVTEDISDFAKVHNGGVDAARVLVFPQKRLLHADSEDHRSEGIALSLEEYQSLPVVITTGSVYWDTKHKTLVYVRRLSNGEVVYVPVDTDYTVRKHGKLDAIVNAYKLEATQDGAGRLETDRYIEMK